MRPALCCFLWIDWGFALGRKHKTNGHRSSVRSRRVAGLLGTVRVTGGIATVETAEGVFRLTERGMREAMPGDTVTFKVKLLAPIAMDDGLRFAIREGGRTVGAGVVTKINK